jgi:hypothetical protein
MGLSRITHIKKNKSHYWGFFCKNQDKNLAMALNMLVILKILKWLGHLCRSCRGKTGLPKQARAWYSHMLWKTGFHHRSA